MAKKTLSKKPTTGKSDKSVEERIEELAKEPQEKPVAPPQVMQVVEVAEEAEKPVQEEHREDIKEPLEKTEITEPEVSEEEEKPMETSGKEVVSEFFTKSEEPSFGGYPDISIHKKPMITPVILWAIGVIAIVLVIGLGIVGFSRGLVKLPAVTLHATPTPTSTPIPTPTPAIDRKSLQIEILNGSGKAGAAAAMKKLLEEKGYTIAGTGNAKSYDYAKTEIDIKAEKASMSSVLEADVVQEYSVGTVTATLKNSLPYDAVVTVGKE